MFKIIRNKMDEFSWSEITRNGSCTFVKESDFLHMTRSNFKCPFLKVSFSFNPADINDTTSGSIASADIEAHAPNAERIANFTSSIPVTG
jgi:hypothetical protein